VRFDQEGNVWLTDRGYPHRLVKLDPRTGEQKDYLLPDPKNGTHEVLVDRDGMIWLPEHSGVQPSKTKRLLGFNPKTEQFERQIPMDPDNVVRNPIKWLQSLAMDSKGNIYVGWIMGGALSKYDRATGKVSVFRVPTPHTIVYGVVADRNDNIWMAEWSGGKIAKFDTRSNAWTEFMPPTYPGHVRRLNVDYQNNVWWGIWSAGKRPGKLVKLDQTTGGMTEYTIPQSNAQPYDVAPDLEGNIWFADSPTPDRAAALGKFNTRDQTFTFYPKPQFAADTPKIQVTRDGAVWYSPRGSQDAPGIGVLYPDMDKITTLGAYYVNGAPGYPFKVATTSTRAGSTR
jgi:virginiamycin B lyase